MRRLVAIIAVVILLTWIVLIVRSHPSDSLAKRNLQSALTDPMEFAKERFTGGIGVAVGPDVATGLPTIMWVSTDSPAHKAGLRSRDVILKVDGVTATNSPIPQLAEQIKGVARGSVTLTIQRGERIFDCTIRRESWKKLRGLTYNSAE